MQNKSVVVEVRSVFDDENYFQLFNIEMSYFIDKEKLNCQYLKLCAAVNSSIIKSKNSVEKEFFESYLSMLNTGRDILLDDISRAELIFRFKDIFPEKPNNEFFTMILSNDFDKQSCIESVKCKITDAFYNNDLQQAANYVSKLKFLLKSR